MLTPNEVSSDRSTCISIPSTIDESDLELIYHTSVGAIVDKLRDVTIAACNNVRGPIHTDVNTVPDVRVNTSYVQTKWSIPSETNSVSQIFPLGIAHSIRWAYTRYILTV